MSSLSRTFSSAKPHLSKHGHAFIGKTSLINSGGIDSRSFTPAQVRLIINALGEP